MEKTNTWRRILLGLSAMLLCGTLTFAVAEIVPARADESVLTSTDVNDIVADGSKDAVTVENDQTKPWKFSEKYSEEGNIAWAAGNSGYNAEDMSSSSISSLKFTVTRGGTLSFDFYFAGCNDVFGIGYAVGIVGYDFSKPPTGFSHEAEGKDYKFTNGTTMAVGRCTNSKYHEPKILEPGVMTSLLEIGDGWFHAEIPVEDSISEVYVAYGKQSGNPLYTEDALAIRKVKYITGERTVNFKIVKDAEGSQDGSENGTIEAKIEGQDVSTGGNAQVGKQIVFTANPAEGNTFYAWRDSATGKILSYEKSITITVGEDDINVQAVIAKTGTYQARVGEKFYSTLSAASTAAQSNDDKTVILVDDIKEDAEIPKGIKLVLPFNSDDEYDATGNKDNAQNRVSWGTKELEKKYLYRKVTLTGNLTVKGEFHVGGVIHYPDQSAQAHTSGAYSELAVNGTVTVESGGVMDVYGRVTGTGGITVKGGGKIYEPFLILDFAGGQNTQDLYYKNQTPFNRYAVINVQCQKGLTIEYRGELIGHASLNVSTMGGVHTLDAAIISYAEAPEGDEDPKGFITLTEGGSLTAIYHDEEDPNGHKKIPDAQGLNNTVDIGYTELIFTGGAIANSLKISYLMVNIDTKNVVGFSIPYNFQITLKSGQYKLNSNFKLMPGAGLTVEEGATLTAAEGKNFFIYDGLVQSKMSGKSYPTAAELTAAGYSTSANFIVNGAFVFTGGTKEVVSAEDGEVISTLLGVIQTTNTESAAKIEIGEHVTLSGKIVDGGTTKYDCNYSEYQSSARVWDKVHKELAELEAGKTYISTYTGEETFILPAADVKYESKDWGTAESMTAPETGHKEHDESGSNLASGATQAVEALNGAWMVEHEAHTYDWTPTEAEKPTADAPWKTLTRTCRELGCKQQETKYLLYNSGEITAQTYKGAAYTVEDLVALFKAMYEDLPADVGVTCTLPETAQNAKSYTVTVTLENAWFLGDDDVRNESEILTFKIEKKAIDVTINDQSKTYDGTAPTANTAKDVGYTVDGLEGNDSLTVNITIADAAAKAGEYHMTATVTNDNYNITVKYTHETYSVYTIGKAKLTVRVSGSSPQDEELKYTIEVDGYKTTDKNLLGEDSDAWKEKIEISGVTKDSEPNNYTLTLTWKSGSAPELENYTVELATDGTYTIQDPLFEDVKFDCDGETYEPNATIEIEYDGEEHTVTATNADGMEVSYEGGDSNTQKDAGTYHLKVTVSMDGYSQDFTVTLKIKQRELHVTLKEQHKTYDGQPGTVSSEQGTGWELSPGYEDKLFDDASVLGITLSLEAEVRDAGRYAIHTQKNADGNYNVIFDNDGTGLYEIKKKVVHVTVKSKTTAYGDALDKSDLGWELQEGESLIREGDIYVKVTTDVEKDVGSYPITGNAPEQSEQNKNYDIQITDGTWTVKARAVTVEIGDQTATYNYRHDYTFNKTMWTVSDEEGEGLAEGEEKDVLNVTLKVSPELTDAGTYAITGTWDNGNYEVTFKGSYEGGEAGTFTVNKQDVSDRAEFAIWEGSNASLEGDHLTLKFAGEPLVLEGSVSITEGNTPKELHFTIDPPKLDEIRDYTVTVTIDDTNYSGSHTFTVTVTNAEGYTKNLSDALKTLGELAEDLDIDALKAEDYGTLVRMYETIEDLTDEEREIGAKALAPYQAFVDKWNGLAEIGDVIETAESIANAPIEGLFAAAAALTALSALAYIVTKGGIL